MPLQSNYYLFQDIFKYQSIELNLRNGIFPLEIPIDYFYHLKTCDIRLTRNIIKISSKRSKENYSLWNYYDIINEIYDDIVDLYEDQVTFNCNRIILSINKIGAINTYKQYSVFLQKLKKQILFLFRENNIYSKNELVDYCFHQINVNNKLLAGLLFDSDIANMESSKLIDRLSSYEIDNLIFVRKKFHQRSNSIYQ